ncbi:hypothetical protein [Phenylobacterium ferrooxidans]|uniref:Uncharacterized protein n=1 Tax=Phenylobacterium ferrooxidans TaxID=2982689 RepID=A0ABW6CWI8_9CAUL
MAEGNVRVNLGGGLAAYLAAADETTAKLLASDDPLVATLREYDLHFRTRLWSAGAPDAMALIILFMNAYQLFLAGVRTALSGHTVAVFPLLRTALESAAYGGLIAAKPELTTVWTDRHRDDAARNACRKAFTFAKAIAPLKNRAPDIHELAILAYDSAIDFGAHPNIKGVFGHVSLDEDRPDEFIAVTHTSLYSARHIETVRGLCACLDFGLAIIGAIALAGISPTEQVAGELQALNDAKNAATEPYSAPR